jgi:mannose-6-phosphate isomerase-like protein (cupin superfamily)
MPFQTSTHAVNVVRVRPSDSRPAESYEGTTDVLFVMSGTGHVTAGGRIEGGAPLPKMPGEIRGRSISGGQTFALTPNAVINIPPSTPYLVQAEGNDLTIVRLKICIDARTGRKIWHYRTVHHDLFDCDNPAAPILATKPPAFDRQGISEEDLIDFTPELRAEALAIMRKYRIGLLFTPPSVVGDGPRNHPALKDLHLGPLGQSVRAAPLATETLLFVSEGDQINVRTPPDGGGKKLRAFDKATGKVVWETDSTRARPAR